MIGVTESAVEVSVCCVFRKDLGGLFELITIVCSISKSVSMTILRSVVMNLKNLFTKYLSASNVVSPFTVRTVC